MKAIIYTEYGSPDVLRLEEVEQPVPAAGEVLIRVRASSLNAADRFLMRGEPFLLRLSSGLRRPKNPRLGGDVAGFVEATGRDVRDLRPGDAVYADISGSGQGGFGEYVAVPEHVVAPKPKNLSFEEAAAVPLAGVTALQGVRDAGRVGPGQRVLIHGASGGVGTFALQIARALGAEVTAVVSPRNVELTRSLGADHVIDYTREDFSRNGRRYDAIIAANGRRSLADYRRALVDGGVLVTTGGTMGQIFQSLLLGPLVSAAGNRKVRSLAAKPNRDDLLTLKQWIEAGKITPVIDDCYPLSEVAAAMRHMIETRPRGKLVITVD